LGIRGPWWALLLSVVGHSGAVGFTDDLITEAWLEMEEDKNSVIYGLLGTIEGRVCTLRT